MKKVYLKPDAEYISIFTKESLANDNLDVEESVSQMPDDWED